jgi:phage antirepressor YoqD-like protein
VSELIKIGNTSVPVLEINGQRMVTLAMIDEVHGRPEGTARRNFTEHRHRFIEGEDYILGLRDEIRTLVPDVISAMGSPNVILLSESGYLLLAKSLNDDLAWTVQRQLINAYFKKPTLPDLNNSEVLQKLLLAQCEQNLTAKAEIKRLETAVEEKEEQLQIAAPRIQFAREVTDSKNLLSVKEAAKLLRWGQNKLFAALRGMKILQWNNEPYQRFIDSGYFKVKLGTRPGSNGEPITYSTTKITGKGLCWLHKTLQEAA